MSVTTWHLARPGMDCRQIDTPTGDKTVSFAYLRSPTMLQVLISIQSMILCEEPYLNEPSWANSGGTPASKQCM